LADGAFAIFASTLLVELHVDAEMATIAHVFQVLQIAAQRQAPT